MAVNTLDDFFTTFAQGKGVLVPVISSTSGNPTGVAAASGGMQPVLYWNGIGTTVATGPFIGLPIVSGTLGLSSVIAESVAGFSTLSSAQRGFSLGWLYKIGVIDLTIASGTNALTHDAATFPVVRTRMGQANTAVNLTPLLYMNVASATTAPIFTMTYKNQYGFTVNPTGLKQFTLPAAATAAQSAYVLRPEWGDSAVQDITAITMNTAGSAGKATLWGFESIMDHPGIESGIFSLNDSIVGGIDIDDYRPAAATSGIIVAYMVLIAWGSTTGTTAQGFYMGSYTA